MPRKFPTKADKLAFNRRETERISKLILSFVTPHSVGVEEKLYIAAVRAHYELAS